MDVSCAAVRANNCDKVFQKFRLLKFRAGNCGYFTTFRRLTIPPPANQTFRGTIRSRFL